MQRRTDKEWRKELAVMPETPTTAFLLLHLTTLTNAEVI